MSKEKMYSDMRELLSDVHLRYSSKKPIVEERLTSVSKFLNFLDEAKKKESTDILAQEMAFSEINQIKEEILKYQNNLNFGVIYIPMLGCGCSLIVNEVFREYLKAETIETLNSIGIISYLCLVFFVLMKKISTIIEKRKLGKRIEENNIYVNEFLWVILNSSNFTENERKMFNVKLYDEKVCEVLLEHFKLDKLSEHHIENLSLKELKKDIILKNLKTKEDGGVKEILARIS